MYVCIGKTPIESALASGFKELANKIAFWAAIEWKAKVLVNICSVYAYIIFSIILKICFTGTFALVGVIGRQTSFLPLDIFTYIICTVDILYSTPKTAV
jgi:hypothetical protein